MTSPRVQAIIRAAVRRGIWRSLKNLSLISDGITPWTRVARVPASGMEIFLEALFEALPDADSGRLFVMVHDVEIYKVGIKNITHDEYRAILTALAKLLNNQTEIDQEHADALAMRVWEMIKKGEQLTLENVCSV